MSIPTDAFEPTERPRHAADDTLAELARLSQCPDDAWPLVLARVEGKLRVLLRFRMSAAVRSRLDEDDVIQDVFVEFIQGLDRFEYRGPGSLQRWLATILLRRLSDVAKGTARTPVTLSDAARACSDETRTRWGALLAAASSSGDVARRSNDRELVERVRSVLASLSDTHREALLLKLYEGLTGREAAERLGIDESTFSVRFHGALGRCAAQLRGFAP
jgi:RNA polymerase sigma factor (sigma-70 family)